MAEDDAYSPCVYGGGMLSEAQREERELMAWFRAQPGETQRLVSITPRERGYTTIRPKRRLTAGRDVRCRLCERGLVWFTNEGGRPADRSAQVAAARHLRGHLDGPAETGSA